MVKKVILAILSFILLLNVTVLFLPITIVNNANVYKELERYNLINDNTKYVSRDEFLENLLKIIGLNNDIFYEAQHHDGSQYPTADFGEGKDHPMTPTSVERDRYYEILYNIAKSVNCLQTYKINEELNQFNGKSNITVREAIVMIECCLNNVKRNNNSVIYKNSDIYWKLWFKSHISGILLPIDSCYWSLLDTNLKRSDMYCLLYRLSKTKRYKYLAINYGQSNHNYLMVDNERSITYKDFLTTQIK